MYTCPMHPEVQSLKAGRCPKCGMKLVKSEEKVLEAEKRSFRPLLVIIGIILMVSQSIVVASGGTNYLLKSIEYFMVGFFIVFGGFKMLDLEGFASGYSTYDLLARRWFGYGYLYPFIELGFGILMILGVWRTEVLVAEILVMGFSGIGVVMALKLKRRFECACLGTAIKLPLTYVTLLEDFGMMILAGLLLFVSR